MDKKLNLGACMNQILVLTKRRSEAVGNNTGHDGVKENTLGIETLGVSNHDGACSTLSRSQWSEGGDDEAYGTA